MSQLLRFSLAVAIGGTRPRPVFNGHAPRFSPESNYYTDTAFQSNMFGVIYYFFAFLGAGAALPTAGGFPEKSGCSEYGFCCVLLFSDGLIVALVYGGIFCDLLLIRFGVGLFFGDDFCPFLVTNPRLQ